MFELICSEASFFARKDIGLKISGELTVVLPAIFSLGKLFPSSVSSLFKACSGLPSKFDSETPGEDLKSFALFEFCANHGKGAFVKVLLLVLSGKSTGFFVSSKRSLLFALGAGSSTFLSTRQ